MGRISRYRVVILIVCMLICTIFINWQPKATVVNKNESLGQILKNIPGWEQIMTSNLGDDVLTELELDDHIYQNYSNGSFTVSLYVGYYSTLKKVGAAHSPLVCFPGQGWSVSGVKQKKHKSINGSINYTSMIVSKSQTKELVLYWFQAYDKTSSGTFLQKIYTLWSKIRYSREDNAFLRVSIQLDERSEKDSLAACLDFMNQFYPVFYTYIKE